MNKRKKYIVWLSRADKEQETLIGKKGASLAELGSLELLIPNGFIVTADAYAFFLKKNDLKQKIKNLLKTCNFNNPEELKETANNIQQLLSFSPVPDNLGLRITRAYEKLDTFFKNAFVAVRSPVATIINIKGEATLVETIRTCWASFFSPELIISRKKKKLDHFKIDTSIVVQKMIQAEASGLILTKDTLSKNKTLILVKAIYGLGELAVQKKVKPDCYWVDKNSFEIKQKEVNQQEIQLKRTQKGNQKTHIPLSKQARQKISDTKIIELAKIGRTIHQHYFFPQTIEWAIKGEKIYVLQTKMMEPSKS